MNLFIETQNLLEKNGYSVNVVSSEYQLLTFEDESAIGFVYSMDSVSSILDKWEILQNNCLSKYVNAMRTDPNKSWNAYTIYLTPEQAESIQFSRIATIEEDLRGTRKIIGTGINTNTALLQVLLPILPIQKKVNLGDKSGFESLKNKLEIPQILSSKSEKDIYVDLEGAI